MSAPALSTRELHPGYEWEWFIEPWGDCWVAEFIGSIALREEFHTRAEAEAWAKGVRDAKAHDG